MPALISSFHLLQTRILVTHGIGYLPKVDQIIVLVDGQISEVGSYKELMDHAGAFADFLKNYLTSEEDLDEEILDSEGMIPCSYKMLYRMTMKGWKLWASGETCISFPQGVGSSLALKRELILGDSLSATVCLK